MATKKKGTRNGKEWTEARYFSFVKSGLRSASQRWPPRYTVINEAYVGQQINPKSGRWAKHYRCSSCGVAFPAKEVEVNHIIPVIPVTGFDNWDGVVSRLFCEKDGLELVCKPCHKSITKEENGERATHKRGAGEEMEGC